MFKTNLRIAWRNLLKHRQFTILNLLGLSTGLACVLLIYLWVSDEMSFDKFHKNGDRLFQVMEKEQLSDGISVSHRTAGLAAEALKKEMPEVQYAAAVMHYSWFPRFEVSAKPENKVKAVGQFASEDFFQVFTYPLLSGNKDQALKDKASIVISESLANKIFGTANNIIGRPIEWTLAGLKKNVTVAAVFSDIPANSSEQFDFVLPFEEFKEISPSVLEWGNNGTNAYLVLKEKTDLNAFNKKIAGFIQTKKTARGQQLFLQKFSDRYLHGRFENGVEAGGRIEYVRLFTIVAIFILIIACINFMNLSTAKSSGRMKEVGIKKVVGAGRGSLVFQYLSESMLMTFASLILAIVLVVVFLPQFNHITSKNIKLGWDPLLALNVLGIAIITGLLAGSYPALYLSGFKPVAVLKGKLKSTAGELWIRKGLVVFQFSLSVIFIISVIVVYKQMQLIQTKNLGYDKANIVYFTKEGSIQENSENFLAGLKNISGVMNASETDHLFNGGLNTTGGLEWQGKTPAQDISFEIVHANYDMLEMMGMKMKEGRSFSRTFGADSARIIFNEAAINMMGIKNPVGKVVKLWGSDREILGVVNNFHFESLHQNIKPLLILLEPQNTHYVIARLGPVEQMRTLGQIKSLYKRFNPGSSFDYKFLDEDFQTLHASEKRVTVLSEYFAGFAIIISCLGLFGLAAFTAQRRQKEIGIRKVMGASLMSIISMLAKDFLLLVLIAILIAFPLAWWATNEWLYGFAYRVNTGIGVFILAGCSIIIITLLTISYQSIRAALANPVKSLKNE